jgi:hypothetical protein
MLFIINYTSPVLVEGKLLPDPQIILTAPADAVPMYLIAP